MKTSYFFETPVFYFFVLFPTFLFLDMKILVLGTFNHHQEFKEKFSVKHDYIFSGNVDSLEEHFFSEIDLVFDFLIDEYPDNLQFYKDNRKLMVFCNVPKTSLAFLKYYSSAYACTLIGFNGLPTMLNRKYLEVSVLNEDCIPQLEKICKALDTEYLLVEDRVGMVTPRVMCMIINEAFYTLQEKTASGEDIDKAMKMGTNYPMGPFEMCDAIGTGNVYEILNAVYEDTKDERYKICPLLKRKYLLDKR